MILYRLRKLDEGAPVHLASRPNTAGNFLSEPIEAIPRMYPRRARATTKLANHEAALSDVADRLFIVPADGKLHDVHPGVGTLVQGLRLIEKFDKRDFPKSMVLSLAL